MALEHSTNERSHILVVDDRPIHLKTLVLLLTKEGFHVTTAATGEEALAHIEQRTYRIAILDVKLPDMLGTQLIAHLHAKQESLQVIMYTGHGSYDSIKEALNSGAIAYVEKGGNPQELLGHVHRADRSYLDQYVHQLEQAVAERTALLQEREERFRQLTEHIHEVFWLSSPCRETLLYVSPAYETIWGRSCASLHENPMSLIDAIHPDDREALLASLPHQRETTFSLEYRIIRPDGSIRWIWDRAFPIHDSSGQIYRVCGIAEDITQRKHDEEEIQLNARSIRDLYVIVSKTHAVFHEQIEALLDLGCRRFHLPIGFCTRIHHSTVEWKVVRDTRNQFTVGMTAPLDETFCPTIIEGNEPLGVEQITPTTCEACPLPRGFGIQAYLGTSIFVQQKFYGTFSFVDTKPFEGKFSATDKDFLQLMARWIGSELERQQDQEALANKEHQLRQVRKMESLGTLAGGIAHDFNNILGAIVGFSELGQVSLDKQSPTHRYFREVLTAANRAKHLVKQILAFSRHDEPEGTPIVLAQLIKEGLTLVRASLPSTIVIQEQIHTDALMWGDPTQIHQVLMNLCSNSQYAMRDHGGTLEITLAECHLPLKTATLQDVVPPGPYLQLTIKDTGHGMTPETMNRLFDPFFTTKGVGEGTGLGLSVVHGILKAHGGAITVSSTVDQGTCFDIFFPRFEGAAVPLSMKEATYPTGCESILFVDDEESIALVGKEILTQLGYRVISKTCSHEALHTFRENPDHYDLVITDQTMPKLTGEEFAKELLRIRPNLPIILCTGFSVALTPEKAKALGVRAFVMKPFSIHELAKTIRQVLMPHIHPISDLLS